MKHHILIDDRSKSGKSLLQIAEALSKSTKGIEFISGIEKEDSKSHILSSIEQGFKEAKEIIKGKKKGKTLKQFIDEN